VSTGVPAVTAPDVLTGDAAQRTMQIAGDSIGRAIAAGKNAIRGAINEKNGFTNPVKRAKGVLRDFVHKGIEIDGIKIDNIDMERLPRLYDNGDRFLPPGSGGGYIPILNKTHLTNEKGDNKWKYPLGLYEVVTHEGTHGLLANLRAAFAIQHPEEYEKVLSEIIDKSIRNGESESILKSFKTDKRIKGFIKQAISENIPVETHLIPKDKHQEFLGETLFKELSGNYEYVIRANKYAKPNLTEKGIEKIKAELVPLLTDQSTENQKRLIKQVESELPQLFALKQKVIGVMHSVPDETEFMKTPELSPQERNNVADFVGNIWKGKERYIRTVNEFETPQLTEEAKQILEKDIMPKLNEFVKMKENPESAVKEITDYVQAQITRLTVLKDITKASCNNEKLPSIGKTLTKSEKQLAKKSMENLLPCLEGNARFQQVLKKRRIPDEETAMQYMFSWEELQANRTSYRYLAGKLDDKITKLKAHIAKHPASKQAESQLQEAIKLREEFKNNVTLLDLVQQRTELKQEIASAPKDTGTLEKIKELKAKLNFLDKEAAETYTNGKDDKQRFNEIVQERKDVF
ncbi:MAG: hypothetical protein GX568_07145, partial [Candidatus Gastranaerophilales bacterium]|nr:hypothetical protein [Candidatus Gastranaerophilales bacterium]